MATATDALSVQHLISPASLPANDKGLSVVSYNVLLPNSSDGWWNYKMYNPPLEQQDLSNWDYRRQLLQERLRTINADVICLQEIAPDSFEEDFAFMKEELGYDGVELYKKKGRFRPATFWKTSHCQLAGPAVHKDRAIITAFTTVNGDDKSCWYVVNCHLQAGKQGPRRLRQMNEAVRGAMTLSRKLKQPTPEQSIRLIVCGDMNGGPECGAVRFLEDGFIDETFREDNEPVSSGRKELPLAEPMKDATAAVVTRHPPPTMVVAELMQSLMEEATYDTPTFSQDMKDRLARIYKRLASSDKNTLTRQDVEQWLVQINGRLGRGDEYRNAALEMGWTDPEATAAGEVVPWEEQKKRIKLPSEDTATLSLEGFINVYQKELKGGKFWGIAHDMAVLGDPLPDCGLFTARYDRIYCSAALQPTAVLDTLADKPCPNEQEPSDHLPVAVAFQAV
ncbi:5'-phosphodiesterase 12 [Seminavis robusta]|uniref:5'-phosphodiesterase 12 n=1 Tax=Seminavis robusta TaxID=568900 RepID=A0A9N8E9W7_9STRA|nr:5'-phosphodiesterase 12 [Seminavis robusta]|eukprot:Sro839_g209300.1 5'-phosphodiesterase 12 (451) ;mRNA; r:30910-32262